MAITPIVVVVALLFVLRWLSGALWDYGGATPLPARATATVPVGEPVEERDLDDGLRLAKFEYSVNGTRLNVIHHPNGRSPRPTLIMVNGGAWRVEDEDRDLWYARGWAAYGYTVVTIAHRPSDVAPFPGPAEDVLAGVDYVLDLTGYGIDSDRLAFFGGSSGGHLATYTAYRLHETHPEVQVRAVVNVFGPTDLRYIADDARGHTWYRIATLVYTPETDRTADINTFLGCNLLRRDCRDQIVAASPITHIGPLTPPTMIVQGQADAVVPWQQATRLADALDAAGRPVELILDPDMGHQLDPVHLDAITEFLDTQLLGTESGPPADSMATTGAGPRSAPGQHPVDRLDAEAGGRPDVEMRAGRPPRLELGRALGPDAFQHVRNRLTAQPGHESARCLGGGETDRLVR